MSRLGTDSAGQGVHALAGILVSPASQATLLGTAGAAAFGWWPLFLVFLKVGAVLFGSG